MAKSLDLSSSREFRLLLDYKREANVNYDKSPSFDGAVRAGGERGTGTAAIKGKFESVQVESNFG